MTKINLIGKPETKGGVIPTFFYYLVSVAVVLSFCAGVVFGDEHMFLIGVALCLCALAIECIRKL